MILRPTARSAVSALLAFAAAVVAPSAIAQTGAPPSLNITPKRMVIDAAHRLGTIYIINQGDEAGTFNIDLVDRVMLPDGQIVAVADAAAKPDQKPYADQLKSAHDLVIVTPRHITLGPRQSQSIRLRAASLPSESSEFRTHLTISTLPNKTAGTTAEQAALANANGLRVAVNSVYAISMPVIVRSGAPDVRAALENVHMEVRQLRANPTAPLQPTAVVSFDLLRQGANSLFGKIDIRLASQRSGEASAGFAQGVGVYAEVPRRHMELPLVRVPAPGDRFTITFTDQDSNPGKVLATIGS